MKVAIDVDGTLGRYPALFGPLMRSLKAAGHQVLILTGNGHYAGDRGERIFAGLGIAKWTHYDSVMVVSGANTDELGRAKAQYLAAWGGDVFIDDHEPYCAAARAALPALMILRVFP